MKKIILLSLCFIIVGCASASTKNDNSPNVRVNNQGEIQYMASDGEWISFGNVEVKDGEVGADGKDGNSGIAGLNGKDGIAGLNGKDGINGVNGKNGVNGSIVSLTEYGELVIDGKKTGYWLSKMPKEGFYENFINKGYDYIVKWCKEYAVNLTIEYNDSCYLPNQGINKQSVAEGLSTFKEKEIKVEICSQPKEQYCRVSGKILNKVTNTCVDTCPPDLWNFFNGAYCDVKPKPEIYNGDTPGCQALGYKYDIDNSKCLASCNAGTQEINGNTCYNILNIQVPGLNSTMDELYKWASDNSLSVKSNKTENNDSKAGTIEVFYKGNVVNNQTIVTNRYDIYRNDYVEFVKYTALPQPVLPETPESICISLGKYWYDNACHDFLQPVPAP